MMSAAARRLNTPSLTLDRIRDALSFIPPADRETWVRMAMAVKSEVGEAGFGVWDTWSRGAASYIPADARDVWRSVKADGAVTVGTLYHLACQHGWSYDGTLSQPTLEEMANQRRFDDRAAEDQAEVERERADCASRAATIWKAATSVACDHPYLVRKGVTPTETLREIDATKAGELLGYAAKSGGEPLTGRLLVVPVKVGDQLSTLELIDAAGRKAALRGRNTKAGGYWAAQPLPDTEGAGITLLIGEGVATALSAREATEHPAVAALSAGNLPAVARAMRNRFPSARLVILADLGKTTNEPNRHAVQAARTVGGLVAVPRFRPDRPEGATDFNDLARLEGREAVRAQLDADLEMAEPPQETLEAAVARLAALTTLDYERAREREAKAQKVRVSVLDREVYRARQQASEAPSTPLVEEVDAWTSPVDGGELLSEIRDTLTRYVVLPDGAAVALSLWTLGSYAYDAFRIWPKLTITSPEKRCGKSTLLSGLLAPMVHRGLVASNISPAAIYRVIEAWTPTLLIDEADTFLNKNDELRGVINSGHTKSGAFVVRTVGDDHEPKAIS